MRNLLQYVAIAGFAVLSACNNPQSAEQIAGAAANTNADANRAIVANKKAIASAYYYKTLASFKGGKATTDLGTMTELSNAKVSLVVMFESGATWAVPFASGDFSKTGDDKFNGLMESHGLAIAKHFEIDDLNEGLVLEASQGVVDNPIEAAREISMIEAVLMVEVKETPIDVNSSTVSK